MTRLIAALAIVCIGLTAGCAKKAEQDTSDDRAHAAAIDDVWQRIDAERAGLATVVNAGMLDDVNQHAFAIRGLVTTLPRTGHMRPDQAARLAGMIETVAAQAEETG